MNADVRIEHDSMGEVEVPADALWGAQTQRAVENFPVSGERIGRDMIGALGAIKGTAAQVNAELGVLDADMADAIHEAAAEVARGEHDAEFPVDVFQTGSGTSSNMNANEVIEYPELGMEAIWKIEVEDFPAFIVVDDKGNDFFTDPGDDKPLLSIGSRL